MSVTADEIYRYLHASIAHSIVVDVREDVSLPGYLRTVTIGSDDSVTIEYMTCKNYLAGSPEGGDLKLYGRCDSLDGLIAALVDFIGPIDTWHNFTSDPYEPHVLDEPDHEENWRRSTEMVTGRVIPVPPSARFKLANVYWKHVILFGEFKRERLGDEEDLLPDGEMDWPP